MNRPERARLHAALGDETRLAVVDELFLGDTTPGELQQRLGVPSNLLAHHLGVLEAADLIRRRPSDGDHRRKYISLVPDRVPVSPLPRLTAASVLFVCRQNSARSQLAAALLARGGRCRVQSAGSRPAAAIHRHAVTAAAEVGLELSGLPRGYESVEPPDLVVSVCDIAGEGPLPFGSPRLHWSIPDPVADGRLARFRAVLSELEERVARLERTLE